MAEDPEERSWDTPNYLMTDDRAMKDVPTPDWRRLSTGRLYSGKGGTLNVELLKEHLTREGRLSEDAALRLLSDARDALHEEPNVLRLDAPVAIVGDLHGQYYDLLGILSDDAAEYDAGNRKYLFLGDYVDRGCFGTEICFLLFAMKLTRPEQLWLLRGNHECRLLTTHFNFKQECCAKYSMEVYLAFMDVFDQLPIAATVTTREQGTFLCIHGGLSPTVSRVDDLCNVFRFAEPPNDGPLCDVLWSDPLEEETAFGLDPSEMDEWYSVRYAENPTRGCGYIFGWAAANDFCEANGLTTVIRGHEVQRAGCHLHRFLRTDEQRKEPLVITVFSAPNYCDIYRNVGAVMMLNDATYDFKLYDCVPHPHWMPHFEGAFDFSIPILMQSILEWVKTSVAAVRRENKRRVTKSPRDRRLQQQAIATTEPQPAVMAGASAPQSDSPLLEETPPGSPPPELAAVTFATSTGAAAPMPQQQQDKIGAEAVAETTDGGRLRAALIRRRESLAKIRPGTVTSKISEFGQIERKNYEQRGNAMVPAELQLMLQGVFSKSRELLLSKQASTGTKSAFDAARWVDHENERRPPVGELKKFWETWTPTKYEFSYTDNGPTRQKGQPRTTPNFTAHRRSGSSKGTADASPGTSPPRGLTPPPQAQTTPTKKH